jgi:hypothetical protein
MFSALAAAVVAATAAGSLGAVARGPSSANIICSIARIHCSCSARFVV